MDFDNHKNFAIGDIITAPSPATSGTSITVAAGQIDEFPTPPFNAILYLPSVLPTIDNAEIVRVTNIVGDDLTITRAQEGTVAKTVVADWRIAASITAKTIQDIETFVNQVNDDLATLSTEVDNKSQQSLVRNEVPGGSINGSNVNFTTAAQYATGTLRVYKNGIRLKGGGNDYTEVSGGFTMVTAPATSTVLLVDYEIDTSVFSLGVTSFVSDETPTGAVNGSNTSFTTSQSYVAGTLEVFINGLKQARTTHVTETTPGSGVFTLDVAPATGDIVRVNYQHTLGSVGNADKVDGYNATGQFATGLILTAQNRGWIPLANVVSYASADAPSYEIYVTGDVTGLLYEGLKVQLTHSSTVKYFFITKVSTYDSGNNRTTITLYGGSDYTLSNSAITSVSVSLVKAPAGFPLNPLKWTQKASDNSVREQLSPAANTWYNNSTLKLDIPIGLWDVDWIGQIGGYKGSTGSVSFEATLSTANNTESDEEFTAGVTQESAVGTQGPRSTIGRNKPIALTAKATYYLNFRTLDSSVGSVQFLGYSPTVIRARCAYL